MGSLTVEAALAVPAFLLFCGMLLTLFLTLKDQIGVLYRLDGQAELLAVAGVPGGEGETEDIILTEVLSGGWLPDCTLQVVRKAWNGRFLNDGGLRFVILTDNAGVYHLTEACTYLTLSIRLVSREEVASLRNAEGAKYHPCERCAKGSGGAECYITNTGRRYHFDRNCSGLKRSWRWVPLEDCGLPPCSRCGGD